MIPQKKIRRNILTEREMYVGQANLRYPFMPMSAK